MNDEWSPEDGAGYIPTEEGGSGRGAPRSLPSHMYDEDGNLVYVRMDIEVGAADE